MLLLTRNSALVVYDGAARVVDMHHVAISGESERECPGATGELSDREKYLMVISTPSSPGIYNQAREAGRKYTMPLPKRRGHVAEYTQSLEERQVPRM